MPFESEKQRRWMHANKPEMAKRWEKHTPKNKKLPERKKPKKEAASSPAGVVAFYLKRELEKRAAAAGHLPPSMLATRRRPILEANQFMRDVEASPTLSDDMMRYYNRIRMGRDQAAGRLRGYGNAPANIRPKLPRGLKPLPNVPAGHFGPGVSVPTQYKKQGYDMNDSIGALFMKQAAGAEVTDWSKKHYGTGMANTIQARLDTAAGRKKRLNQVYAKQKKQNQAHDMPSYTEQDRPKKSKEIYSALKREHPEMPAEMKARIASRQGKSGKQKQGPPYKGKLSKKSQASDMLGSAALGALAGGLGGGVIGAGTSGLAGQGARQTAESGFAGAGIGGALGSGAAALLAYLINRDRENTRVQDIPAAATQCRCSNAW